MRSHLLHLYQKIRKIRLIWFELPSLMHDGREHELHRQIGDVP
jgi:hypothetical protein